MQNMVLLSELFTKWAAAPPTSVISLPPSGSHRRYFRLLNGKRTAIGVLSHDIPETRTFLYLAKHLRGQGISVPEIYAVANDYQGYLIEDFGDISLFNHLQIEENPNVIASLLKKAVEQLAVVQINGARGLDFSQCYPSESFDRQSIFWDLNYFKYCFLKVSGVDFDEAKLERDFGRLASFLLKADASFFMYRDFQSRNIMLNDKLPCGLGLIDFQGGRRGPLQYDLTSLLFQAKANFSQELRESLFESYLQKACSLTRINRRQFIYYYYPFVLFRILQVLGAYGFRGMIEKKDYFVESIPYALRNIQWLLQHEHLKAIDTDYLFTLLDQLSKNSFQQSLPKTLINSQPGLVITINSFSYKNEYPKDLSGNGGGYIFDCRGLNNPGRVAELRDYTGCDTIIADYLQKHSQVETFLQSIFALISLSVDNYLQREFTNLFVAFGCTGGQHRSVYCAEQTAKYLHEKYPMVRILVKHQELPSIPQISL